MKLRYNLDTLIPGIAERIAKRNQLVQIKPNIWISKNHQEFYSQENGLRKSTEPFDVSYIESVRYSKTDRCHVIFIDNKFKEHKRLIWSKADVKHLASGYTHRVYTKTVLKLTIYIHFNGKVQFSTKKGFKTLSLQNILPLTSHIPDEDLQKLFTLPCNLQWLEEYFRAFPVESAPIANNLIKTCNSFQQFITSINTTTHKVSYKKFTKIKLNSILEIMNIAARLHNPHVLLDNAKGFFDFQNKDVAGFNLFEDYFRMITQRGEKAWYSTNPGRVRQLHDAEVLKEMKNAHFHSIKVSPVALVFKTYFPGPNYELIECGKRLLQETLLQSHCVNSYNTKINNFKCFILSIIYDELRFTAEISIDYTTDDFTILKVIQLRGFANQPAPSELHIELNLLVQKFNDAKFEKRTFDKPRKQYSIMKEIDLPITV